MNAKTQNLISVMQTETDGYHYTRFSAIFHEEPTKEEIKEAQVKAGYPPQGYGGPWNIATTDSLGGCRKATWMCSGSCD